MPCPSPGSELAALTGRSLGAMIGRAGNGKQTKAAAWWVGRGKGTWSEKGGKPSNNGVGGERRKNGSERMGGG